MNELNVFLLRHAERERGAEEITPAGKRRACVLGRTLRDRALLRGSIVGLCSPQVRARQTLEAILGGTALAAVSVQEDVFLDNELSLEFKERLEELEAGEDRNAAVDHYLQFDDQKPDAATLSPLEVAQRVARVLLPYLENMEHPSSPPKDAVNLVVVTHSGVLECFLTLILGDRTAPRGQGADSIGGRLDYLEVARLHVRTHEDHELSGQMWIRDREYGLDLGKLRNLGAVSR